jgi:cyclophilin family peptidyl-prolyl cis-trans isomerase
MDEEVRKAFDRIEQEVLARTPPEEAAAGETPYLVPRETPAGVRYVRSHKRRRAFPPSPGNFCIGVLFLLAAAGVTASVLLAEEGAALAGWQMVLAVLYPLQLALDLVGFARLTWSLLKRRLGDLELELSADRLRTGLRWGPLWIDSDSILLDRVRRLVVVKRAEGEGDPIWELVAEGKDGSATTLVSADDPVNVLPLARDLHGRLARQGGPGDRWPALVEEDRPAAVGTVRPPRRPLLPGGAWTWLAVHVAGAAGLWQLGTLPWFKGPPPPWHISVLVALAALQGLILLTNVGLLNMKRETAGGPPMRRYALLAAAAGLTLAAPGRGQDVNPQVVLDTSLGRVRLELFADKAPVTVKNFLRYVDDKFYDDTVFHRVIPGFMIQGGGLTADLRDRPTRAPIKNEAGNGLSNARGTLAMARASAPDSATAQFFINVKDNRFLDRGRAADGAGYAVFGRVVEGLDVVDRISRVKTGPRGPHTDVPVEAVVIRSLRRAAGLTLVVNRSVPPARLFAIAAYVEFPARGQALTLDLPPGVERVEGRAVEPVPASASGRSLVLWKARVLRPGTFVVRVRSSTGLARSQAVTSRAPGPVAP